MARPARQLPTTSRDPLWNGMLIGAAVGAGTYYLDVGAYCEGPCAFFPVDGFLVSTGIWAGIGALIDFLR